MIVDNESGVTYTVQHGLVSLDSHYEVTCVNSGEGCIELLERNKIPDLILLGIMLPGMNGWQSIKKLKTTGLGNQFRLFF